MQCPSCADVTLAIADRQGIEIDYCPTCRGVWLDRGELDRLIERASAELQPRRRDDDDDRRGSHDRDERYEGGHRKKKRSSMLSEFFDFG